MATNDYDDDRPRRSRDDDDDSPRRRDEYSGGGGSMKPHRGTMILIFGILGFFCCLIFGILAIVMGGNDLKEMQAGRMDPSGEGLTKAGRIVGIVACVFAVVGIVLNLAFGLGGAIMGGGK